MFFETMLAVVAAFMLLGSGLRFSDTPAATPSPQPTGGTPPPTPQPSPSPTPQTPAGAQPASGDTPPQSEPPTPPKGSLDAALSDGAGAPSSILNQRIEFDTSDGRKVAPTLGEMIDAYNKGGLPEGVTPQSIERAVLLEKVIAGEPGAYEQFQASLTNAMGGQHGGSGAPQPNAQPQQFELPKEVQAKLDSLSKFAGDVERARSLQTVNNTIQQYASELPFTTKIGGAQMVMQHAEQLAQNLRDHPHFQAQYGCNPDDPAGQHRILLAAIKHTETHLSQMAQRLASVSPNPVGNQQAQPQAGSHIVDNQPNRSDGSIPFSGGLTMIPTDGSAQANNTGMAAHGVIPNTPASIPNGSHVAGTGPVGATGGMTPAQMYADLQNSVQGNQ